MFFSLVPFKPLLLGSYWFDVDEKNMGRARRALSNDPGLVLLGAIVPEKKIVKEKFFFPLFPLNRYSSAPIGPIWTKKIWAQRARRVLSNDHGPVLVGAMRTRRALSNDPRSVLLGAIVSEKKIVKEKCFFPLFPLNRYNSAPIGSIWTKKIRASAPIGPIWTKKICSLRERRALSRYPAPVLVRAIVSEKKIVKENFFSSVPFKPL
ncbi:LOW QUALITY PROTEIN: hypothetical protein V1477_006382 [Vespula maculifrons]|uniref:Ribosomal protein S1 n=1 Tax=Vespula maculifrons TaxID=7453 RepID=A0ABD2CK95_VESMC